MGRAPATPDFPVLIGDRLYWQETRPTENGRTLVLQRSPSGRVRELLPAPWNVRTRVHEYGGRCWLATGRHLFFANAEDQRIYRLDSAADPGDGDQPVPVSPETGGWRFADFCHDPRRQRLLAVAEQFADDREPRSSIVAIDAQGSMTTLVQGADFYACPRLNADQTQLCWLAWHHPQMPWDSTELYVGDLDPAGAITGSRQVAGGTGESVFQPSWSPAGDLVFVSDRSGWWNLYRQDRATTTALLPMAAEFGLPLWNLGLSTYGFIGDGGRHLLCCYCSNEASTTGNWQLILLDSNTGQVTDLPNPCTQIGSVAASANGGCFVGASADSPARIYTVDANGQQLQAVASHEPGDQEQGLIAWYSRPQGLSFATGPEAGHRDLAHGYYYPPCNPDFQAPAGSRPPLLVICHGGPTAATSTALNYKIQFWTSRGFAVIDVNYRGSTGYGRTYREKLRGYWGVRDVQDVIAAAEHCVEHGLADPEQLLIRGSSAGGFTVLAALTGSGIFRAGASLYGIGDLETLVRDTHKFESHYLDQLVGPYPGARQCYRERSPIHHVDRLRCPVIFFQGLEDRVVPPEQAEVMVRALETRGLPVAYLTFADEGHGFRQSANVSQAFAAELYFYRLVLGLRADEKLPPVPVRNLPDAWQPA